jgi:hyperosmotically inducible protein
MKISKALAASLFSVVTCLTVNLAHAQDLAAAQTTSEKAVRSANWKLQQAVRQTLNKQKIDTSDIRIRARSGAVALSGTVKEERQISLAGTAAGEVPGVNSLKNGVTVRVIGQ